MVNFLAIRQRIIYPLANLANHGEQSTVLFSALSESLVFKA